MGHSHEHGGALRAGARYRNHLLISFGLVLTYFVVELIAGLITNSLALLSDAGHMFTDVLGLGMALAAIHLASSGAKDPQRTFGLYRVEILAALANGLLLFGVAIYILFEAFQRIRQPPEIPGTTILLVAIVGLAVNLVSFFLLRSGAKESLNVKGAYLEVLSDAVGSVGVIIAAIVLKTTGWRYIDPIVGAAIGLWILPRTYRFVAEALRVLVQAAPAGIDMAEVERDLEALEGVIDVHDFHLWTLTSGMEVASAHIRVGKDTDAQVVLGGAKQLLKERYRVAHATLQVEDTDHRCEGCSW